MKNINSLIIVVLITLFSASLGFAAEVNCWDDFNLEMNTALFEYYDDMAACEGAPLCELEALVVRDAKYEVATTNFEDCCRIYGGPYC